MAVALKVNSNVGELSRKMLMAPEKLSRVAKFAITDTAQDMYISTRVEMVKVFDNPRPYTKNALFIKSVKRFGLEGAGIAFREFGVKGTPAYKYLMPNIKGGPRRSKRHENALRGIGVLGAGDFTVMGKNYPRDAYGDIAGGRYTKMLNALQQGGMTQADRKKGRGRPKKANYFVVKRGQQPIGIAEREGNKVTMMLVFIRNPQYKPIFRFYEVAEDSAKRNLPAHFSRIFRRYFS